MNIRNINEIQRTKLNILIMTKVQLIIFNMNLNNDKFFPLIAFNMHISGVL